MKPMLIVQHISCEAAGEYEHVLRDRGVPVEVIELDVLERLPDWRRFCGVVAMGGPMGCNDAGSVPWLRREIEWIRELVLAGAPYWGVCLGAQLLAASLNAAVYPAARVEVGTSRVALVPAGFADPVFRVAPSVFETFQWHSDTFDVPAGGSLLATSSACTNQAFAWGRAYGLQFHLEVTVEDVLCWSTVPAYAASLSDARGSEMSVDVLVQEVAAVEAASRRVARALFMQWLDRMVVSSIHTPVGGAAGVRTTRRER